MTDYKKIINNINDEVNNYFKSGLRGFSIGSKSLEELTGRIEPTQLWIIGGYNGTGKSYFVLNIIEKMLQEWRNNESLSPRIAVFSTELTAQDYIYRQILMKVGIYKVNLEKNPKLYMAKIQEVAINYLAERQLNPHSLNIFGDITSFEQIEDIINKLEIMPNIIFVDHIQDLSVSGRYKEEDTIPELALKFKKLAFEKRIAVIVVSQINNYSLQNDFDKNQLAPFSYGKQLNNKAHTSILLKREKVDGQLEDELQVYIIKARNGRLGKTGFKIKRGYVLQSSGI
jgi:replicative DNA helicase